jgi:hypothetical protein
MSFFKRKMDYEGLFSSADETCKYIYGNRSKTVEIMGNQDFIDAFFASKNTAKVNTVINNEAMKGDIPSLKWMIWFCHQRFLNAETMTRDRTLQLEMKVVALTERVMYCEKAMALGLDQSYYAMTSCWNLSSIFETLPVTSATYETQKNAMNGVVKYARLFLESGYDDPDLIGDAKNMLWKFAPLAKLFNEMGPPKA